MKKHIQLLILLTFGVFEGFAKDACSEIFRKLNFAQSQFVQCAVEKSAPVTMCIDCYDVYGDMTTHYNDLIKNQNCTHKYISQNRLDLVYNMELYLDAIWNKGFCDDCFDESRRQSNETSSFMNMHADFESCLIGNTAPCINCMPKYILLNDFFKDMEKLKKGKVCFDMQDAMNRTRLKWSKELKCCHRDFNVTLFLVASGIFCAIPVMFYLGMYGYTKRLERNHELIDSTYGTANQQNSPSTSNATVRPIISTREAPLEEDYTKPDKVLSENIQTLKETDSLPSTSGQTNASLIAL